VGFVNVNRVVKTFRSSRGGVAEVYALRDVTLSVQLGEMVVLLGASGSGKTTLLRCLAGLEHPDSGTITLGDTVVFSSDRNINLTSNQRNLGMIFQSYAIWPHMTVLQNVAFPLEERKVSGAKSKAQALEYLRLVGCDHLAKRYPHELSGGQQQRIALARALVYEPRLVLFDEPLSNLDAALREQLRYYIREIKRSVGFTSVYVTHDQAEAFFVGDRVAVMSHGSLLQVATPDEVYNRPATMEVASFLGAGNIAKGEVTRSGARWLFRSPELGEVDITDSVHPLTELGGTAELRFRPEDGALAPVGSGGIPARVLDRVSVGSHQEYLVELTAGNRWRCRTPRRSPIFSVGESVHILLDKEVVFVFGAGGA